MDVSTFPITYGTHSSDNSLLTVELSDLGRLFGRSVYHHRQRLPLLSSIFILYGSIIRVPRGDIGVSCAMVHSILLDLR